MRVHLGHADQARDPLLAAALGAQCSAHRGLAYVVFEDLQLADFGNRIPALSFEVFASGAGAALIPALADDVAARLATSAVPAAAGIAGFAHEGGSLAEVFDLLGKAIPMAADTGGAGLTIGPTGAAPPIQLPEPIASAEGEFGTKSGFRHARRESATPSALRYYDSARDYQPGFQRAAGRARSGNERTLELPATLSPDGARSLIDAVGLRDAAVGERMQLRVAVLDPGVSPGAHVGGPGEAVWRVEAWEWRSTGVELALVREPDRIVGESSGAAGTPWRPLDRLAVPTIFHAFELPWDGTGSPDARRVHAALGAGAGRWAGASLYVERAGALEPLATTASARAVSGQLNNQLASSPALMFEPFGWIELVCDDRDTELATADGAALASGANRLLVGDEIVQFMEAFPLGEGRWRLSGLLRGRGATEAEALAGHAAGTRVVLLDERLLVLDGASFDPATERLAAIGLADAAPVFAVVSSPGRSRQPLAPVHAEACKTPTGLALSWTRRARGAWAWRDAVEVPLIEESEHYEVGAGSVAAPVRSWTSQIPSLTLSANQLAPLPSGTALWVRQIGSHARSPELLLHILP